MQTFHNNLIALHICSILYSFVNCSVNILWFIDQIFLKLYQFFTNVTLIVLLGIYTGGTACLSLVMWQFLQTCSNAAEVNVVTPELHWYNSKQIFTLNFCLASFFNCGAFTWHFFKKLKSFISNRNVLRNVSSTVSKLLSNTKSNRIEISGHTQCLTVGKSSFQLNQWEERKVLRKEDNLCKKEWY